MSEPRFSIAYRSGGEQYTQTITGFDVLAMKLESIKSLLLKGADVTELTIKQDDKPDYITISDKMTLKERMAVIPALGRILKVDMGKRVYFKNGYAQAENLKQFKERTNKDVSL